MESNEQRKHIRFYPDPLEIALFDVKTKTYNEFNKADPQMETDYIGLIENESHNGASIVLVLKEKNPEFLLQGKRCIVQLGPLSPMRVEIKWIEWIEERIVKIGITILD
jgi:hypothetical protein